MSIDDTSENIILPWYPTLEDLYLEYYVQLYLLYLKKGTNRSKFKDQGNRPTRKRSRTFQYEATKDEEI